MKIKILSFLLLSLTYFTHDGQKNIDQVLRKYKNDEGVVNMNFTGESLKKINGAGQNLKSNIDYVDIIIFKGTQDISKSDNQTIQSVLTRDKFDLLVDVKNQSQKIRLYAVDDGAFLNKVYAQVHSDDMIAYFILSGKIIFSELSKLGMNFVGDGAIEILDFGGTKKKQQK